MVKERKNFMEGDTIPLKIRKRDASSYGLVAHVEPLEDKKSVGYHYLRRGNMVHLYIESAERDTLHFLCSESAEEWEARQREHESQRTRKHYRTR